MRNSVTFGTALVLVLTACSNTNAGADIRPEVLDKTIIQNVYIPTFRVGREDTLLVSIAHADTLTFSFRHTREMRTLHNERVMFTRERARKTLALPFVNHLLIVLPCLLDAPGLVVT